MTRLWDEADLLKPADPSINDDDLEEFTLTQVEILSPGEVQLENLLNAHDKNILVLKGRLERLAGRKQDLCKCGIQVMFDTVLTFL